MKGHLMTIIKMFMVGLLSMAVLTGCGVTKKNEGVVNVKNNSSSNTNIKDIYLKRSNSEDWGKDQLVSTELKPGASKRIVFKSCDHDYDFKVVYLDDSKIYKRDRLIGCHIRRTLTFKD